MARKIKAGIARQDKIQELLARISVLSGNLANLESRIVRLEAQLANNKQDKFLPYIPSPHTPYPHVPYPQSPGYPYNPNLWSNGQFYC